MHALKKSLARAYSNLTGSFAVELMRAISPYTRVLDVGCGAQSPISPFSAELNATGLDGHLPAIQASKNRHIHARYLLMRLQDVARGIRDKSFDCVLCCDVIEHFEKEESRVFVRELERIARKRVLLFTPNGFVPQGPLDGNPFQIHRCGWDTDELQSLEYTVTGIYGYKPLRGERADYRIRPRLMGKLVSDLTQPWARNHPKLAFALLACKNII